MTSPCNIHGPGLTQAEYLPALAAGYETGSWNDNGTREPAEPGQITGAARGLQG